MDWQASLQQFLDNNPDLPQGEASAESEAPAQKKPGKTPRLEVVLDRKGRSGKTATIIAGFPETMTDDEILSLAATLKKRFATGGSSRGREILIQGDRRADLASLLPTLGYRTK